MFQEYNSSQWKSEDFVAHCKINVFVIHKNT